MANQSLCSSSPCRAPSAEDTAEEEDGDELPSGEVHSMSIREVNGLLLEVEVLLWWRVGGMAELFIDLTID